MKEQSCWACGTNLRPQQKVCLECRSWQNWRRFLTFSNSTASLLIALFSVSALLAQNIKGAYDDLFPSSSATIFGQGGEFKIPKMKNGRLSILANIINTGSLPILVPAKVFCSDSLRKADFVFDPIGEQALSRVLRAGENSDYYFTSFTDFDDPLKGEPFALTCTAVFMGSEGQSKEARFEIDTKHQGQAGPFSASVKLQRFLEPNVDRNEYFKKYGVYP